MATRARRLLATMLVAATLLPTLAAAVQFSRGQVLAGCVAAVPLATEAYARAPPSWRKSDLPRIDIESDDVVVVLHGAGGPDANTRRIADALRTSTPSAQVVEYPYVQYVGDQLQAPYNAMRVGDEIASQMERSGRLKSVHIVGVSVGAFAADRLATRLAGKCNVRLTLLDPFCGKGLLGLINPSSAFGVENFGKRIGSGNVVSVLNTDDPVPSTNLPLKYAANLDITRAKARAAFTPLEGDSLHSWPAAWFGLTGPGKVLELAKGVAVGGVGVVE